MTNLQNIAEYLNDKKVPFIIKQDYKDSKIVSQSIFGVTITKKGKFFKANGIIIAGNIAKYLI